MLFSGEATVAIVIPSDIVSNLGKHEQQRRFQLMSLLTEFSGTSAIETNEDALVRYGFRATGLPYWPVDGLPIVPWLILGADTPTSDRKDGDGLQSATIVEEQAESQSWLSDYLRTVTSGGSTSLMASSLFETASSPLANETFSDSAIFFASPSGYPDSAAAVAAWKSPVPSAPPQSVPIASTANKDGFVSSLPAITDADAIEEAIVSVYGCVDDLLLENRVPECNAMLARLVARNTHADILLAFLMSTATVPRDQIPNRESLYNATRQRFVDELGDVETSEILDRLR